MERRISGDIAFVCGRWPLDEHKSTLVFIHGAGGSSLLWLRVLPAILETIAADMRAYVAMIDRMGFSAKTPSPVKRPFLEDSLRAAPAVVSGDFKACDRFDAIARLGAIRAPVLVVSAEDDRLTPPKYGLFLGKSIPGAVHRRIPDAGHFVPLEKPQEVHAAIRDFLDANGI